jgi:hypothetical protein
MVQIIPRTQPTIAERLIGGLEKGADIGSQYARMGMQEAAARKTKQQEASQKRSLAKEYQEKFLEQGLNPQIAELLGAEMAGMASGGSTKSAINALRELEASDRMKQLFGGEGSSENSFSPSEAITREEEPSSFQGEPTRPKEKNYDREIQKWSRALAGETNPANRSFIENQIKNLQRQEEMTFRHGKESRQEREFAHRETSKFGNEIREGENRSREIIDAVKQARNVIKKEGATGATARNIAFKYLQNKKSPFANMFQTEDTQALLSASKALAGGFRELFGARPTQAEFFWYENILPDILKDAPTNEQALKYFEKVANFNLKKADIFDNIVKKNKGFRPIDVESQVRNQMRGELNKLVEEGYRNATDSMRVNIVNPESGEMLNIPANRFDDAKKEGFQVIP